MPSDIDDDPPISHLKKDGRVNVAKLVLLSISGGIQPGFGLPRTDDCTFAVARLRTGVTISD
jgi:hypothetical protein